MNTPELLPPVSLAEQVEAMMLAAALQELSFVEAVICLNRRAEATTGDWSAWDAIAFHAGYLLHQRVKAGLMAQEPTMTGGAL